MHKLYRDPSHVDVEALAPRKAAVPQDASSGSGPLIAPPVEAGAVQATANVSALLEARFLTGLERAVTSLRTLEEALNPSGRFWS